MQTLQVVRDLLYKAKERQLELENREATLVRERTQVCGASDASLEHEQKVPTLSGKYQILNTFTCHLQTQAKLTALEARNGKLEYQILHLKRAVKAGDTALQAAHSQH